MDVVGCGKGGRALLAPYDEILKEQYYFTQALPFACRGLHRRPAKGAGDIFWFAAAANAGGAKPRPYCEITK